MFLEARRLGIPPRRRCRAGEVERLEFSRWDIADGTMQTPVVPPVDPLRGCQLHLFKRSPGTVLPDDLGLVEPIPRLRECIVVRISTRAHRTHCSSLSQSLGVADG